MLQTPFTDEDADKRSGVAVSRGPRAEAYLDLDSLLSEPVRFDAERCCFQGR